MSHARIDAAIVGGGVAGTALMVSLAARAPVGYRTVVFDRSDLGPGTAYAPQSASLLLNGPVRAMSLVPGDEPHFERWLVDEPGDALICRARYGSYARATAAAALASRSDFRHIRDEVVDIERNADGTFTLSSGDGTRYGAQRVVLALGNFPPADRFLPAALREFSGYFGDPWRVDVGSFEANDVVLLGSRLTAMDVVALLDEHAFRGRIHVVSRHGLLPYVEDPRVRGGDPKMLGLDTSSPYALLRSLRRAAATPAGDWRAVVDAIRAITPAIWSSWNDRDRKRFLRHAQSIWAVHRYRVPAATYASFARLQAEGRVRNHRGRIAAVERVNGGVELSIACGGTHETVRASYVVNCTGPNSDIRAVAQPLVRNALRRGLLRADPLHLGVDATAEYRVLDENGAAQENLYAIGPLLRGLWYETTAIPEITKHAAAIAGALLAPDARMMVAG